MTTLLPTPAGTPRLILGEATRGRSDGPRRGRGGRGVRGAARGRRRPGPDRRPSPRSPRPGCGAAAARASRPATSGAPSASAEDPVRYVVANGYEADPAPGHEPPPDGDAALRGGRGRRDRGPRRRRPGGHHRRPRRVRGCGARPGVRRLRGRGGRLPRARTCWARAATSPSRSARCRAPTCWARRRSCSRPSRGRAASPSSARPTRPSGACSGTRPWSTTWSRWRRRPGSSSTAPTRSGRSATRTRPGTLLVQVSGAVATPGIAEVPTGTTLREILDLAGGVARRPTLQGGPGRRPDGRPAARRAARHAVHLRGAARRGRPRRLGRDRRRRRDDLHRRPRPPPASATAPTRPAARRSPAGSGCAGSPRSASATPTAPPGPPTRSSSRTSPTTARPSALCDHERLAPSPLRTAMRYFGPEIDDHILRGICPAGVCSPIRLAAAATGR